MNLLTSIGAKDSSIDMKCCFGKIIPLALCALCITACLFGCAGNETSEDAYDSLEEITLASNADIVGNREYVGDVSMIIPDDFHEVSKNNPVVYFPTSTFNVNIKQAKGFSNESETAGFTVLALENEENADEGKVIDYYQQFTSPETDPMELGELRYDTSVSRTKINNFNAIVYKTSLGSTINYPDTTYISIIPIMNSKAICSIEFAADASEYRSNSDYYESILSTIEIGDQNDS